MHNQMSRQEHVQWCKDRALVYLDTDDTTQAFTSMASDLGMHSETAKHVGIELGMMLMMSGSLKTKEEMREFIEGFN